MSKVFGPAPSWLELFGAVGFSILGLMFLTLACAWLLALAMKVARPECEYCRNWRKLDGPLARCHRHR